MSPFYYDGMDPFHGTHASTELSFLCACAAVTKERIVRLSEVDVIEGDATAMDTT